MRGLGGRCIRRISVLAALVGLVASGACGDEAPGGPGFVTVDLRAPVPLGAAVIDLDGGWVEEAEDPTGGWVALTRTGTSADGLPRYRMVVVLRQAGSPRIRLRVPDVNGRLPVVTVQEATDANNAPVTTPGSIEVVIRP